MALNDEELFREFTRARIDGAVVVLEVQLISWAAGPHCPESTWVEVKRLASGTDTLETARQRRQLLERRRYFRICARCSERNPVGWMHDSRLCQGCAERTLGVVH